MSIGKNSIARAANTISANSERETANLYEQPKKETPPKSSSKTSTAKKKTTATKSTTKKSTAKTATATKKTAATKKPSSVNSPQKEKEIQKPDRKTNELPYYLL